MKSSGTMKAHLWAFAMIFLVMLGSTGCFQEKKPFITLGNNALEVSSNAQSYKVAVESNIMWTASSDQSWLNVLTQDGSFKSQVEFAVEDNYTSEDRVAIIQVEGSGIAPVTIQVRQASAGLALYLLEDKVGFGKTGGSKKVAVMSNHEWQVLSSEDWCTVSPTESGNLGDVNSKGGSITKELTVTAAPNLDGVERTAEISVICTAGVKEPVVRKLQVVQSAEEFYFVVPTKTWNLRAQPQVVDVKMQIAGDNVEVFAEVNADWISFFDERPIDPMSEPATKASSEKRDGMIRLMTANPDGTANLQAPPVFISDNGEMQMESGKTMVLKPGETHFLVLIAPNDESEAREGQISITARSNGGKPVVEVVTVKQNPVTDDLELAMNEVVLNGKGEEVKVQYTTSYTGEIEAFESGDWLTAQMCEAFEIGRTSVAISAEPNLTGQERVGFVIVEEIGKGGNALGKTIKVTQLPLLASFEFDRDKYTFTYLAGESIIALKTYGKWHVDKTMIPDWLKVTPESGVGDETITVSISDNIFTQRRDIQILFKNEDLNSTCILNIEQEGNPAGLKDFGHLGKGFDTAGQYAFDGDVRAEVLSWRKLYNAEKIAGVSNTNLTNEMTITGKTRDEYVHSYGVSAGLDAKVMGFTAGVSTNFSESSLSSSENSFATFRHMTKKQIIKLHGNVTPQDVLDCRSDMFLEDIANLSASDIIVKYGTHVIFGYSLGGVLEYSMTANMTGSGSSVDWGLAVKAGFEMASYGGSVSAGYQQFDSVNKEEYAFESKLVCRGGESQFASTGVPGGDSKSTYDLWLNSLTDPYKWVMVDFEGVDGRKLVPIYDFIDDPVKKEEVKKAISDHLNGIGLPEQKKYMRELDFTVDQIRIRCYGDHDKCKLNMNLDVEVNGKNQRNLLKRQGTNNGQFEIINRVDPNSVYYDRYWEQHLSLSHGNLAYKLPTNTPIVFTFKISGLRNITSGAGYKDKSFSFRYDEYTDQFINVDNDNIKIDAKEGRIELRMDEDTGSGSRNEFISFFCFFHYRPMNE